MPNPPAIFLQFVKLLRNSVGRLPNTVPTATVNDSIYQCFHSIPTPNTDRTIPTFHQAYLSCFHPLAKDQPEIANVKQGEYGMELIILCLEELSTGLGTTLDDFKLVLQDIQELLDLIHQRVKQAPVPMRVNSGGRKQRAQGKRGRNRDNTGNHVPTVAVQNNSDSDPYDADYAPGAETDSSGGELDMEAEEEFGILAFGKTLKETSKTELDSSKDVPIKQVQDDGANRGQGHQSNTEAIYPGVKPGPSGEKGKWALSHYQEIPTPTIRRKSQEPVWAFKCKWCPSIRTVERTPGCSDWGNEVQDLKDFNRTNFISHIEHGCPNIPKELRHYKSQPRGDDSSITTTMATAVVTQKRFNSSLAKAVVRDNHSMTFGEGNGMIEFFGSIYPAIRLPKHQTLQRHLYHLFDSLGSCVGDKLKDVERHAIATDAWSSKNSVYSLAGLIIFFIDPHWRLNELVLDIIDLDAEHSGSRMGKLVYDSLEAKDTAHRAFGCVTDNASSNSVLNAALAERIRDRKNVHIDGKALSFTCVVHAFHLVCIAILSHLGVIEPGDHFSEVKQNELGTSTEANDDPDEPELEMEAAAELANLDIDFEIESETETDSEDEPIVGIELDMGAASRQKPSRLPAKGLKIHEIVVHVSAGPKRRKAMRRIIAQTCPKDVRHLFFKKSMPIRWGSVLAEIERALALRRAIVYYVANLRSNKTGKALEKAKRLQARWDIDDEEWDVLIMLAALLKPFQAATEAMSRRDVPTLAEVIPTFDFLERKLVESEKTLRSRSAPSAQSLLTGITAGLLKLRKYKTFAHRNDLCLVATILNPRLRLRYLELWPETHARASVLFTHIFENYHSRYADSADASAAPLSSSGPAASSATRWEDHIYANVPSFTDHFHREVQDYLNGNYPCQPGVTTLGWWAEQHNHFPTIAHMARHFLCIPAASVSVERLFSQCKLTLTDVRSSMSYETARRRICCQHWMKAGVGMGIDHQATHTK